MRGLKVQLQKTNETQGTNPLEKEIKLAVINEIDEWLRTNLNDYRYLVRYVVILSRKACPTNADHVKDLLSLYVQIFPMGARHHTTTVEADIAEFTRSSANRYVSCWVL